MRGNPTQSTRSVTTCSKQLNCSSLSLTDEERYIDHFQANCESKQNGLEHFKCRLKFGKNSLHLNSFFVNIFLHIKARDTIQTVLKELETKKKRLLKIDSKFVTDGESRTRNLSVINRVL